MFTDDELRTLAIALDVTIDGFRGKGPVNIAPMMILRNKLHNMLRAAAREVDNRPSEVIVRELRGEWPDHYAENPPHGAPGHRLSRNCDQCVENGS